MNSNRKIIGGTLVGLIVIYVVISLIVGIWNPLMWFASEEDKKNYRDRPPPIPFDFENGYVQNLSKINKNDNKTEKGWRRYENKYSNFSQAGFDLNSSFIAEVSLDYTNIGYLSLLNITTNLEEYSNTPTSLFMSLARDDSKPENLQILFHKLYDGSPEEKRSFLYDIPNEGSLTASMEYNKKSIVCRLNGKVIHRFERKDYNHKNSGDISFIRHNYVKYNSISVKPKIENYY